MQIRRLEGNPVAASAKVLGVYLRASALIVAFHVVFLSIGFAIVGVPMWGLMAMLCAVLALIPHLGGLIGIGLVLLVSGIGGMGFVGLGITAGVWLAAQIIEAFWLAPRLIGRPLGLRPLAVFAAILLGSLLFGPIGFLLAVPVLAIGMVWLRYFRRGR